jgi:hypothetical protein
MVIHEGEANRLVSGLKICLCITSFVFLYQFNSIAFVSYIMDRIQAVLVFCLICAASGIPFQTKLGKVFFFSRKV